MTDTDCRRISTLAEAQAAYSETLGHKGNLVKISRDGEPPLHYQKCPCGLAAAWEPETAARKGWPAFNGPATRCRCNGENGDGT